MNVTILGAGNMGTALAKVIASNGHNVKIWNIETDPAPLEQIEKYHENKKYLPGIKLSGNVQAEPNLSKALKNSQALVIAVPSKFVVAVAKRAARHIKGKTICLDASKGLTEKLELVPTVLQKILPAAAKHYVGSLSGPAIAGDLAKEEFAAMAIASTNPYTLKIARKILENNHLKLIATTDLIGVELCGAFKNVYAIALGLATGLNYPLNTISALVVAALKEMTGLIKAAGGKTETALGLAGVGDLIGTGLCPTSRNHRFGQCLSKGMRASDALSEIKQVVEGALAAVTINRLAKKYQIKLPLANLVGRVIKGAPGKIALEKYLKSYC